MGDKNEEENMAKVKTEVDRQQGRLSGGRNKWNAGNKPRDPRVYIVRERGGPTFLGQVLDVTEGQKQ